MRATVIAHGDAPPVFEPSEHIFDFVALLVEGFVIFNQDFPVAAGRDAGLCSSGAQGGPEPVAVIAPINQHLFCGGQLIQQDGCAFVIASLSFGQNHRKGFAVAITNRM